MSNLDTDSSTRLYMQEITKTPLLTAEEELELAERILKGDEKAREHMIKANLRLVVKIARDYSNYGVPLADLISEGNIGLMKAVEKFDPEKGGKLSTYAAWWIKQSIKRALSNQGKTIRLPVHLVDKLARIRRITAILAEELGREPTDDELVEELGIPRQKLAMLKQASQRPTSLDAPVNDDVGMTYAEMISDDAAESPLESLANKNYHGELEDLLKLLNERESSIIDQRFGLNGKKPLTLEEIGRDFGVSRERIRQLQNSAIAKMKRALGRKEAQPKGSLKAESA
jgi:RNA polymerase primary sigma factor